MNTPRPPSGAPGEPPRDPLHKLLLDLLGKAAEKERTAKRNISNLQDQLIALCNEFLAADRKQHSLADVILALAHSLANVMAQNRPDSPGQLLDDIDQIIPRLRTNAVEYLMSLHCAQHHADHKHSSKEPGA